MEIPQGTHTFGPENGSMWIKTERGGAAAVAGHDLLIQVTEWRVTLAIDADPGASSVTARVDSTSLRVRDGFGGMQPLDDADKESIDQTINDEVLAGTDITYRSSSVELSDAGFAVEGELTLAGVVHPLAFDIAVDDEGRLRSTVVVTQTSWGMEPYSALWGTLKVADAVEITVNAALSSADLALVDDAPEPTAPEIVYRQLQLLDPGVSSFVWATVFFGYMWLGMLALDVAAGTALVLALVAGGFVFLFVRTRGLGREDASSARGQSR